MKDDLNPFEIRRIKIPVIVRHGPVLIPEFYFDNYYIPETLSESINHFAEIEVHDLINSHKIV